MVSITRHRRLRKILLWTTANQRGFQLSPLLYINRYAHANRFSKVALLPSPSSHLALFSSSQLAHPPTAANTACTPIRNE